MPNKHCPHCGMDLDNAGIYRHETYSGVTLENIWNDSCYDETSWTCGNCDKSIDEFLDVNGYLD